MGSLKIVSYYLHTLDNFTQKMKFKLVYLCLLWICYISCVLTQPLDGKQISVNNKIMEQTFQSEETSSITFWDNLWNWYDKTFRSDDNGSSTVTFWDNIWNFLSGFWTSDSEKKDKFQESMSLDYEFFTWSDVQGHHIHPQTSFQK